MKNRVRLSTALLLCGFSVTAMAVTEVNIPADIDPKCSCYAPETFVDSDKDGVVLQDDQCLQTTLNEKVDAKGCSVMDNVVKDFCAESDGAAAGCYTTMRETKLYTLKIEFPNNSDKVMGAFQPELNRFADFMKKSPGLQVSVEGHTDSRGSESYNENLSFRRAQAVVNVLVNRYGIDRSRLTAVGMGETDPVDTNATEAGRQHNRRVVMNFSAHEDKRVHRSRLTY